MAVKKVIKTIPGNVKTGGASDRTPVTEATVDKKDDIIARLIPAQVSECALYLEKAAGEPCMDSKGIDAVGNAIGDRGSGNAEGIIAAAKEKLGCDTERCVLGKLTTQIGAQLASDQLYAYFKVSGPTDSQLLNNIHIDDTMKQWQLRFPLFYAFNFNMRNYASYSYDKGHVINRPDTLATIGFNDLYTGAVDGKHYKCCGCIINTDVYQGDGKHWMALFADARGSRWTVEFFNSSGNAPAPEWINWLEKTKVMMENLQGAAAGAATGGAMGSESKHIRKPRRVATAVDNSISQVRAIQPEVGGVSVIRVTTIRHQKSKSECGMYALFYVWARLNGVPPEYFTANAVPDQLMFEFRQHLFHDPSRATVAVFNWDKYKNTVKIEWERGEHTSE